MKLEIRTDDKFLTYIDYDKELSEFLKCPVETVRRKRRELKFEEEWRGKKISNIKEANKMYAETQTNLFRQAQKREKRLVLYRRILKDILTTQRHYELDMDFSLNEYRTKTFANYTMQNVLDYGCGIGDIGLAMSMLGYRVDLLEVDNSVLKEFMKWRFKKRWLPFNFIPYGERLKGHCYDIVVCVDVLEHHEKPREAIMDIYDSLRRYGYLFLGYDFTERREDYQVLGDLNADEEFIKPFIKKNFIVKDKDSFWLIKK